MSQVAKEAHIRVIHSYGGGSWKLAPLARLPTIWSKDRTLPPGMAELQVGAGWQKGCGHTAGVPAGSRTVRTVLSALSFLVLWCFCEPLDLTHETMRLESSCGCRFGRAVFLRHRTRSFSGPLLLAIRASFSLHTSCETSSQKAYIRRKNPDSHRRIPDPAS